MRYLKSIRLFESDNLYLDSNYGYTIDNCNDILLELMDIGIYAKGVYFKQSDGLVLNVCLVNRNVDEDDVVTDSSIISIMEDVIHRLCDYLDSEGWYLVKPVDKGVSKYRPKFSNSKFSRVMQYNFKQRQ